MFLLSEPNLFDFPKHYPFILKVYLKYPLYDMYRTNFLIGATIGIMTALLVINMPHPVNASTCSASASAGGVSNNKRISDFAIQQRQQTRDQGRSSASVAFGGQGGGTECSAANNGGGGIGTSGGSQLFYQ